MHGVVLKHAASLMFHSLSSVEMVLVDRILLHMFLSIL